MTLSRQHNVLKYAPVEGSARLLLLIIALHANDEGLCWPSTGLLASETRLTRRRVQQLLREFEDAGYIRLVVGDKRGKISQIYISDFGAEEENSPTPSESDEKEPKRHRRRRTRTPKGHAPSAPDFATSALKDELLHSEIAKSSASQGVKVAKSGAPDCEILSHTRVERQVIQSNVPKDNTSKDIEKASSATKSQQECEISVQASQSKIEAPEAEPVTTRLQFSMERERIRKVEREEKTRRAIMGTLGEDIEALLPVAADVQIEPGDVADSDSGAQCEKTDVGTPSPRPPTAGIPSSGLAGAVGKVIGGVARAREAAQEEAHARYLRVVAWLRGYDLLQISDAQREALMQAMEYLMANNYREEDLRRF